MYEDSDGNFGMINALLIASMVEALVGGTTNFVSEMSQNNWDINKVNLGVVLSGAIFGAVDGALLPSNFDAKKMTGVYNTSKGYVKSLKSLKKIGMYKGKMKAVIKTIAKKSSIYAGASFGASGAQNYAEYVADDILGWI